MRFFTVRAIDPICCAACFISAEKARKSEKLLYKELLNAYFCHPPDGLPGDFDSVAQLVEQLTLNQRVESSSLSGVTGQSESECESEEVECESEEG